MIAGPVITQKDEEPETFHAAIGCIMLVLIAILSVFTAAVFLGLAYRLFTWVAGI